MWVLARPFIINTWLHIMSVITMFAYCHGIYFVASKEIMGISRTSESLLFCIIFLFPGNSCWENYSSINRHDSIEPIKSELNCSISFRKKSYLT